MLSSDNRNLNRFEDENDYQYEKVSFAYSKITTPRKRCRYFSLEKLALLCSLKDIKPSPDRKMIEILTFDNLFPPLGHSV